METGEVGTSPSPNLSSSLHGRRHWRPSLLAVEEAPCSHLRPMRLRPGSLPSHLSETLLQQLSLLLLHRLLLPPHRIIPITTNRALQAPAIPPSNPHPLQFSANFSTCFVTNCLKESPKIADSISSLHILFQLLHQVLAIRLLGALIF